MRSVVFAIAVAALGIDLSAGTQSTPQVQKEVAPTGTLRVGVYPGSPTSMIRGRSPGQEIGLTVELGREFARRLGIPVALVEFPQIADVLDGLKRGDVDFTVTNASPARAKDVDFSASILGVELGYLVTPGSRIAAISDIDAAGVRVGVTAGGSSHATLSKQFTHASVVPAATLDAALALLRAGQLDAYATNKAILFEMRDQLPGSRVLDGRWGIERFAVGIPKGRPTALDEVRKFADAATAEGLVRKVAERAGLRGIAQE